MMNKMMSSFRRRLFLLIILMNIKENLGRKSPKLNRNRLLLPYNVGVACEFILKVSDGGCWHWTSSDEEICTVSALETKLGKCSSKALVSAVSSSPQQRRILITATHLATINTLDCEAFIDRIHQFDILTTSHVLYVGREPLLFEIQARNKENDVFSSLGGLEFEWIFEKGHKEIAKVISFSESCYSTPWHVERWEKKGLRGSSVLIQGVEPGITTLVVKIKNAAYKNIPPATGRLIVLSDVLLHPSNNMRVLPGTKISCRITGTTSEQEYLLYEQYVISITNSTAVSFDKSSRTITAKEYGKAAILLKDKRIHTNDTQYQQVVDIHVVVPEKIEISISPNEVMSVGELDYELRVEMYAKNNHRIYLPDNVIIKVDFTKSCFQILYSTPNGTYHVIKPLKFGVCTIKAELLGFKSTNEAKLLTFNPTITESKEVTIQSPLHVSPSYVILPWDPITRPSYKINLHAIGGSRRYDWESHSPALATVHVDKGSTANATILTHEQGDFDIMVKDSGNLVVFAKITVQSVADIEILPSPVEAERGSDIMVPLALYGYRSKDEEKVKTLFDDCSQINVKVEFDRRKLHHYPCEKSCYDRCQGCQCIHFRCKDIGFSSLMVIYGTSDSPMKRSAVISCYNPLKLIYPNRVILPLGSSIDVVFKDGPVPWLLHREGFRKNATVVNSTLVKINIIDNPFHYKKELHVFRVLCVAYGETSLQLSVSNNNSSSNPYPVTRNASAEIACSPPGTVRLRVKPSKSLLENENCPLLDSSFKIPFYSLEDFEIKIWVKDKFDRSFINISSFDIRWKMSDPKLAVVKYDHIVVDINTTNGYRQIRGAYQTVTPSGKEGSLVLTAEIVGYKREVMDSYGNFSTMDNNSWSIQDSVDVELVDNFEVIPRELSLFNFAINRGYFYVEKGSGYFDIAVDDPSKARILYHDSKRHIEVIPINDGILTLRIKDLCLNSKHVSEAKIRISGLSVVNADVPKMVEIGKTVYATVSIFDRDDHHLSLHPNSPVRLHIKTDFDIISIKPEISLASLNGQMNYSIHGLAIGNTYITFNATIQQHDVVKSVASDPIPIEVYPPLYVYPSNITLTLGASIQLVVSGGPQADSDLQYEVEDETIAKVSKTGIVTANAVGKTSLLIACVSSGKAMIKSATLLQEKLPINVFWLMSVRIKRPTNKIQVGVKMMLSLLGEDENGEFHPLETNLPNATIFWSVNNPDILKFENYGAMSDSGSDLKFVIKAIRPGFATVCVRVKMVDFFTDYKGPAIKTPSFLESDVQIQVYEQLKLTHPKDGATTLLMYINTETTLNTNRDSTANVQLGLSASEESVVRLRNRVLISGSQFGEALLIVTAEEKFGIIQKLTIIVQVRPINFMSVSVDEITKHESTIELPVGFSQTFKIFYHDNLGNTFHAVNANSRYALSRYDFIHVAKGSSTNTLVIEALSIGETVLKVWNEYNPTVNTNLFIKVEDAIIPSNSKLIIGEVVCFQFTFKSVYGEEGKWSSNGKQIFIHPEMGIAMPLQPGVDTVSYRFSNRCNTRTNVEIMPITSIRMNACSLKYISNVPTDGPYKIQVEMVSSDIKEGVKDWNCNFRDPPNEVLTYFKPPFQCTIEFENSSGISASELFSAEIIFDWKIGRYYCKITSIIEKTTRPTSTLMTDILVNSHLKASPVQSTEFEPAVSSQLKLAFIPAFHIDVYEIVINRVLPNGLVTVTATPQVLRSLIVTSSYPPIMEVFPAQEQHSSSNSAEYRIQIHTNTDLLETRLFITFICYLTNHSMIIPIKLINFEHSVSSILPSVWTSIYNGYLCVPYWCIVMLLAFFTLAFLYSTLQYSKDEDDLPPNVDNQAVVLRNHNSDYPHRQQLPYRQPYLWTSPYSGFKSSPHGYQ